MEEIFVDEDKFDFFVDEDEYDFLIIGIIGAIVITFIGFVLGLYFILN